MELSATDGGGRRGFRHWLVSSLFSPVITTTANGASTNGKA
jgi:hypothetical protein